MGIAAVPNHPADHRPDSAALFFHRHSIDAFRKRGQLLPQQVELHCVQHVFRGQPLQFPDPFLNFPVGFGKLIHPLGNPSLCRGSLQYGHGVNQPLDLPLVLRLFPFQVCQLGLILLPAVGVDPAAFFQPVKEGLPILRQHFDPLQDGRIQHIAVGIGPAAALALAALLHLAHISEARCPVCRPASGAFRVHPLPAGTEQHSRQQRFVVPGLAVGFGLVPVQRLLHRDPLSGRD